MKNGAPAGGWGKLRAMAVSVLATKLFIPRARQALVPRTRLMERLNASLQYKLTLVSAPAGFGKTTLLAAWARELRQPVAWLALDEADNDPTRFARYLVAALQQIDPAIGRDVLGASAPRIDMLIDALINDLAASRADFLLVLDDFHLIDQPAIHEALHTLVAHQPPQMHLVLATREDPPLPLARLRARGQLLELRAQDLRFSLAEAAAFLKDVMGLALNAQDVSALESRVEGWVAGLQLAALSLQHRANPGELIDALSGNHHFILTYLTEEVLRQLAPDVQTFLLQTAILNQLSGPLCDALTGRNDSAALLERLYVSNAFVIPLDETHQWYRYHHLFADLLRSQLSHTQPQQVPVLHARASAWYEAQEDGAREAVEHAFAALDYPRLVRLMEAYARPVLLQGYAQTVEDWLRRLPPEWRMAGSRANLAFAGSLMLRGQLGEMEPYLRNAEAGAMSDAVSAEVRALRAGIASVRGDTQAGCRLAEEAVALAPTGDLYLQGMLRFYLGMAYNYAGRVTQAIDAYHEALPLCRASENTLASMLIVANLALLYQMRGQLHAAAEVCRQTIDSFGPSSTSPALATVYCCESEVLFEWGEQEAARKQLQKWLDLSRRGGHVAALAYGGVVFSRIQQAEGDLPAAQATLEQVQPLLGRGMPAWVAPQVVAQQVALALAREDVPAAQQALARTGVRSDDATDHTREVIHMAYVRLLSHEGRTTGRVDLLEQALGLAGRVMASAEAGGRMGRVIELLALRALLQQTLGDAAPARDDLLRALKLAEPEGYLRLFVGEGEPMRLLIDDCRLTMIDEPSSSLRHYVDRLLAAFPQGAVTQLAEVLNANPQPAIDNVLTERETEVLRLMAAGLTYQEIAARLVVSLNTVRFHVKGIYGKLGVEKRMAAIAKARALGLI
jgi:LuxR family maltose regulon positive regulatory protein